MQKPSPNEPWGASDACTACGGLCIHWRPTNLQVTSDRRHLQLKHATDAEIAATDAHSAGLFKQVRESWRPTREQIMEEEVPVMLGKVVTMVTDFVNDLHFVPNLREVYKK